jgi:hypothetical protein
MEMTYSVPRIVFPARLAIFAGFAALGAAVQILLPGGAGFFLGTLAMVPGLVFIWARNYRNKPVDLGLEDWQPTGAAEFDRIKANLHLTRTRRFPVVYRTGFGIFITIALAVLAGITGAGGASLASRVFWTALVLLLPFLFSGNMRLWTPQELAFKMRSFEGVLKDEKMEGGEIIITPYLRLDKDKQGRRIPEDVRLMVEPRRKPEDFMGVQFQVAVNKGPNGSVPYMYAVFLCKGKGASYERLKAERYGDMIKEPGGDKEYGYIVVRQKTSGGGYNTTDADCKRLFNLVKDKLMGMRS